MAEPAKKQNEDKAPKQEGFPEINSKNPEFLFRVNFKPDGAYTLTKDWYSEEEGKNKRGQTVVYQKPTSKGYKAKIVWFRKDQAKETDQRKQDGIYPEIPIESYGWWKIIKIKSEVTQEEEEKIINVMGIMLEKKATDKNRIFSPEELAFMKPCKTVEEAIETIINFFTTQDERSAELRRERKIY